eukprot:CAMPEP_0195294772 /NCGR_PEP_ID=MMETSP0707-20130614/15847_1 /TAXON_ID=33640 /ORGANISM="Asterionellopsis glacialis, Strain CCMP134" /LENGTH=462 /DNA_ID=CAMNT_0040355829 /DNA_START=158 /DNA_END=1546 /DNA_ORIENTATION=+
MIERNQSQLKSDITIFGATGFVAKYAAQYLLAASKDLPRSLKLTLAGRNSIKLKSLKETLLQQSDVVRTNCEMDIFVADCNDNEALVQMASRTRVVMNCAGPFDVFGSGVVAACVQTGADYVDITGEVEWAGSMRVVHGDKAASSGSRIISLCGFDSVPSDLSIFAAVQALKEASQDNPKVAIKSGCTWHSVFGAMNGGTLHTALDMQPDMKHCVFESEGERKGKIRKVPFMFYDPLVLAHPMDRFHPNFAERKEQLALTEWLNQLPSFDSFLRSGVSIPFLMAAVNSKVIHASAVALEYGPKFTYRERFLPIGYTLTVYTKWLSAIPAFFMLSSILAVTAILKLPIIGKQLALWALPPGTGSPDFMNERGYATVRAEVIAETASSGTKRAFCEMKFKGDPGNLVTGQTVSESALSLVFNRSELPSRSKDGFGTPAELLGKVLLKRLEMSTVRPVKISTSVE